MNLEQTVRDALDWVAEATDFTDGDPRVVAVELIECDPALDGANVEEVAEYVAAWQRRQNRRT